MQHCTKNKRSLLSLRVKWQSASDFSCQLKFSAEITMSSLRPDTMPWSVPARTVIIVELTLPWEEEMEASHISHMLTSWVESIHFPSGRQVQGPHWNIHTAAPENSQSYRSHKEVGPPRSGGGGRAGDLLDLAEKQLRRVAPC